jgi:hypothetical protein
MAMTDTQRILAYLRSVSPQAATNSEILDGTGIEGRHLVYQLTQELMEEGRIHGKKQDQQWFFWVGEPEGMPEMPPRRRRRRGLSRRKFEELARKRMSEHYGEELERGYVGQVHKQFDFVAPFGRIVGDAVRLRKVSGTRWPPSKGAAITEHVWLLEKTGAPETFLVFGNERQVPVMWLERYGNLASGVTFFFLSDDGELEELVNLQAVGGGST